MNKKHTSTAPKKTKTGIARLLEIAGQRKGMLFLSVFFAVLSSLITLVPYILVFYVIQELAQPSPDFLYIQTYLIYAGSVAIVGVFFLYISAILSHIAAFNILFELRKYIVEKLGRQSMGTLMQKSSGAFKKILYSDVETIELFIAHNIPDFVKSILLPIITIAYLFSHDWRLASVSLIPLVLLAVWLPLIYGNKKEAELINKYHQSNEDMNAGIVEYVNAIPVMKIFGQSAETFSKYGTKVKNFERFVGDWIRSQSPAFALFMSFVSNATLPILALGLFLYFRNGVSMSVLILFLLLGTAYIKQLFVLNTLGIQISLINRGVRQIDELVNQPPLPENDTQQTPKDYTVQFDNVSFAYNENHEVLKNINFTVHKQTITALVGPSGAGKSTVGQLLARFWDTSSGTITIGGIPIKNYPQDQLANIVSFVFQDSFMFQRTMSENIDMGMNKTQQEIETAAKIAQIHELILSLPQGYNTRFGESGVHLSGGEQQRFQLARAILKNAPILILDEATAFSDPENEYKIQQAFSELIKNKTVIIIAHRLSTITNADQIVVFDKGEIVAKGTHNQLLEKSELYEKMWNAHTRAKEFMIA